MKIELFFNNQKEWQQYKYKDSTLFFRGFFFKKEVKRIAIEIDKINESDLEDYLTNLDGNFSFVYSCKNKLILVADKIRSYPIFYSFSENLFKVTPYPHGNLDCHEPIKNSNDALIEIMMSGYTIGDKTIYENLNIIQPGEFLLFKKDSLYKKTYFNFLPKSNRFQNLDEVQLEDELTKTTINILKKTIKGLNNREVVIPLSAGNDSRLIASGFKYLGYKNVKCFSYGVPNNFEAKVAKKIADKLNYEFKFIPLTFRSERKFYKSDEFKEFLKFADNYCSVPYFMGLSAIKYIKETNWVSDDAIFLNGNSGDFITGGHINKEYLSLDYPAKKEDKNFIVTSIFDKHFSLWADHKKYYFSSIKKTINEAISNDNSYHLANLYESFEFMNRQCKYVINGQRIYEFYGYEWRMPLWDSEYLEFWRNVPIKYKLNQKLYKMMLQSNNWGNVWRDIPVNHLTVRPLVLIPLRFFFKIIFGLFGAKGKKFWKQFDISVFFYWREITRMTMAVPYIKYLSGFKKGMRNHVSWHSINYIDSKKKG